MNHTIKLRHLVLSTLLLAGCASKMALSEKEVSERYPQIAETEQALQLAKSSQVDLLSPSLHSKAVKEFSEAKKQALKGSEKALSSVQSANAILQQASQQASVSREELAMVLDARERAIKVGAREKFPDAFSKAEQTLKKYGDQIAKGKIADVREERRELAEDFVALEVESLKKNAAESARNAIKKAKAADAVDYAPVLMGKAQEELALAEKVLEANRDATDKAVGHADLALTYANRAFHVTEVIKEFKQSDMSDEQIVVWYQNQLSLAVKPIINVIDFSIDNKSVINAVAAGLSKNKSDLAAAKAELAAHKSSSETKTQQQDMDYQAELAKIDAYYKDLLATTKQEYASKLSVAEQKQSALDAERQKSRLTQEKFENAQRLFSESEAVVYRKGNDVLIRAFGFSFASGKSEIESVNFALMNKIIKAIQLFPESTVEVSGHTDNRGADELNMSLSKERAEKVSAFLVDVGQIQRKRVSGKGFGETRPLASNDTPEGRASNRRVEILIKQK